MKVVYLSNAKNFYFDRWYQYFVDIGYDVTVISGDTSQRSDTVSLDDSIEVHYLPEKKLSNPVVSFLYNFIRLPFILYKLKKLLLEISPDVIHAHSIQYGFWGALSGFHPLIITPMGSDAIIYTRKYLVYKLIAKYSYRRADLITQDSFECFKVAEDLGVNERYNHIIQNGVDTQIFNEYVDKEIIRDNLSISDDAFVIFHCRDMKPLYNIENLISSFAMFLEKNDKAILVLAFMSEGSEYHNKISDLAHSLKIEKSIRFCGRIDHGDIKYYHSLSDVHVSIPLSDSMPSSVTEAMAMKVPVVLSRLPWTTMFFEDKVNCLLVNPFDPEGISNALYSLYLSDELKNSLKDSAYQIVLQHIDYRANMKKMNDLMLDLVDQA